MGPLRSACFAVVLVAHGCIAAVVHPKQPVARQGHAEAKHVGLSAGKVSPKGAMDNDATELGRAHVQKVSKKITIKQAPSPLASLRPKQDKRAAHGDVSTVKHPKQPVARQGHAEAEYVSLSASRTSSKGPMDDLAKDLGKAFAHKVSKKTTTKQAPSPQTSMRSKQDKRAAHGDVSTMKHSKQPVARQVHAEAEHVSSKEPMDDEAMELGKAYAHEFSKKKKTKSARSPRAKDKVAENRKPAPSKTRGTPLAQAPSSGNEHVEEPHAALAHALPKTRETPKVQDTHLRGSGGASEEEPRETVMHALPKEQVTPMAQSPPSNDGASAATGEPEGPSATPPPEQIDTRLSDNAENMIEAAVDVDPMGEN